MEKLYLQDIYIYPVKSLAGISVQQAEVQQTGLQYDRRWMLTDREGNFLSQRTFPQMAMLQVSIIKEGLLVNHKRGLFSPLTIPFNVNSGRQATVQIWDDACEALIVCNDANEWFSHVLETPVQLVYMPATSHRHVEPDYATNGEIVSFADAYPFMMIGQSSLDDLNTQLNNTVANESLQTKFCIYRRRSLL